jgi:hypothetical protein
VTNLINMCRLTVVCRAIQDSPLKMSGLGHNRETLPDLRIWTAHFAAD